MDARPAGIALVLLVSLASCAGSSTERTAASTSPPSTAVTTRATTPAKDTTARWRLNAAPSVPEQKCSGEDCVLLGTEDGKTEGDLRGDFFRGNAAVFAKQGRFVVGTTSVFRGTVNGCGSGTLVLVGTEVADLHRGTGEWRVAKGFGTGDLARVTGHGTGTGTVDATGYHSQWEGELDCGR